MRVQQNVVEHGKRQGAQLCSPQRDPSAPPPPPVCAEGPPPVPPPLGRSEAGQPPPASAGHLALVDTHTPLTSRALLCPSCTAGRWLTEAHSGAVQILQLLADSRFMLLPLEVYALDCTHHGMSLLRQCTPGRLSKMGSTASAEPGGSGPALSARLAEPHPSGSCLSTQLSVNMHGRPSSMQIKTGKQVS